MFCGLNPLLCENLMKAFLKSLIPCSKSDIALVIHRQESMLQDQKEILERLCNLEHMLVDGQMREALERLCNIEEEMVVRLSHIEEKEDDLMQNAGGTVDRKIRIKLFERE